MRPTSLVASCFIALFPLLCQATTLSLSTDGGRTWAPLQASHGPALPLRVLLRAPDAPDAPTLHLPRCVLAPGLRITAVRLANDSPVVGLRVQAAPGCHLGAAAGVRAPGLTIAALRMHAPSIIAQRLQPDWLEYAQEAADGDVAGGSAGASGVQKRGWFSGKYTVWVMGFVAIALAQGIRKGLAEMRDELEREEAERLAQKTRAVPGQVRVVAPHRKKGGKGKRKGIYTGAYGSGK